MLIARRKFVQSSLLFGAVMFLGNARSGFASILADDGQLSDNVLQDPVYRFTRETFEPYVGGYFEAPNARGEMVALKLLKVDSYKPNAKTKITTDRPVATETFSLLFSAEAPLPSLKSIHPIKHGALGEFKLGLIRRDGPNREIYYEAVFNHLR